MKFPLLAVFISLFLGSATARADIAWERDYGSALAKSRATGRPLFIDFYTDWCGVCKKVDREVYPDARVQQLAKNFVMLKLDAEREGAPQARAFGVRGYPTLIWLSPQGQQLQNIAGGPSAAGFAQVMQQVLQIAPSPRAASSIMPRAGTPRRALLAGSANGHQQAVWRQQTALHRAINRQNAAGVLLLDENGTIALDAPTKKAKLQTKAAKKVSKSRGY